MNVRIYIIAFFCGVLLSINGFSQELNCKVDIVAPKNQSVDPTVFKNLEFAITEFMNGRKWTDDSYKDFEKIKCAITLNITSIPSDGVYEANAIIQSQRQVYNSTYNTVVFSNQDKDFTFKYNDLQVIEYNDANYTNNLTSLLAYYAYTIIGFDYETFANDGGTPFFVKAQNVINNIPQNEKSLYKGWSQFDGTRNRFVLNDNLLNKRYSNFRKAFFTYHFNGLDRMYDDVNMARITIGATLNMLDKINSDDPNNMPLRIFFQAKPEELVNIYSKADMSEKAQIVPLLQKLDPINNERYKAINK